MGATTEAACLKFAEAAAAPGERQLAEFGSARLVYDGGRFFRSDDGGQQWHEVSPSSGAATMRTLNRLSGYPQAGAAVVSEQTPAGTNAAEPARPQPPAAVGAPVSIPVPGTEPVPKAGLTHGCQLRVAEGEWQVRPAGSVEDCGRQLQGVVAQVGAVSGQAYWSGTYLFQRGDRLYRSVDGVDWYPLP